MDKNPLPDDRRYIIDTPIPRISMMLKRSHGRKQTSHLTKFAVTSCDMIIENYLFIIPIISNVSVTSSEIIAGTRRLKLEDPEFNFLLIIIYRSDYFFNIIFIYLDTW